jgi:hypothetical protein
VKGNVFNEGIIITNGVGDESTGVSTKGLITGNTFKDFYNDATGAGRYDTIVINGNVPAWGHGSPRSSNCRPSPTTPS